MIWPGINHQNIKIKRFIDIINPHYIITINLVILISGMQERKIFMSFHDRSIVQYLVDILYLFYISLMHWKYSHFYISVIGQFESMNHFGTSIQMHYFFIYIFVFP